MGKIDIKQIILDVITMHEDPDLECLHEEDYEEFADEVEKRIKNHGVSHHVSECDCDGTPSATFKLCTGEICCCKCEKELSDR